MSDKDDEKFHWSEGMKYAGEGMKALFLLNGFSSVSMLTFIGNENSGDDRLVYSMGLFALGALLSVVALFSAYFTQLQYGNDNFGKAWRFHNLSYGLIFTSVFCFAAAVVFAACAFIEFGGNSERTLTAYSIEV